MSRNQPPTPLKKSKDSRAKPGFNFDIDRFTTSPSGLGVKVYPHSCRNADKVDKLDLIPYYEKIGSVSNISEESEIDSSRTTKNISRSNVKVTNQLIFSKAPVSKLSQDIRSHVSQVDHRARVERLVMDQKYKTDHYRNIIRTRDDKIVELTNVITGLNKEMFYMKAKIDELTDAFVWMEARMKQQDDQHRGLITSPNIKEKTGSVLQIRLSPQTNIELVYRGSEDQNEYPDDTAKSIYECHKKEADSDSLTDSIKLRMIRDITRNEGRSGLKSRFSTEKSSFNFNIGEVKDRNNRSIINSSNKYIQQMASYGRINTIKANAKQYTQSFNAISVRNKVKTETNIKYLPVVR